MALDANETHVAQSHQRPARRRVADPCLGGEFSACRGAIGEPGEYGGLRFAHCES